MKEKIRNIFLNALPVLFMVGLIPFIRNDYILSGLYVLVILLSLWVKREKKDFTVFFFGLAALTISEALFVSTGVETFVRNSLFGIMPLWLPLLWGYGFIAIKRAVEIL